MLGKAETKSLFSVVTIATTVRSQVLAKVKLFDALQHEVPATCQMSRCLISALIDRLDNLLLHP